MCFSGWHCFRCLLDFILSQTISFAAQPLCFLSRFEHKSRVILMWAIYWRSVSAIVLVIIFLSYCHQQFSILDLDINFSYLPTLFWCLTALFFCAITVFQRKGLIYLLWGNRLAFNSSVWRDINFSTILFFIGLAILSKIIHATASIELWTKYKLYAQPAAIIIWPFLLGSYLQYRIKK